jgi:hypothetical protein
VPLEAIKTGTLEPAGSNVGNLEPIRQDISPNLEPIGDKNSYTWDDLNVAQKALDVVGAVPETIASMVGGLAAAVPATVIGAGNAAFGKEGTPGERFMQGFAGTQRYISEAIPYEPETISGKKVAEKIGKAFEYLPEKAGDVAFEKTGSPLAGAAAKTAVAGAEFAAMAIGGRALAARFGKKPMVSEKPNQPVEVKATPKPVATEAPAMTPEQILASPANTKLGGTNVGKVLEKFDTPEQIQNVFVNAAKNVEASVEASRRGVVTWQQAEDVGRYLAKSPQKVLDRKVGQALNAEQMEGMKFVLKKASEEVHDAARKAIGGSDADLIRFEDYLNKYYGAIQEFMGARAEAGRALNVLRKQFANTKSLASVMEKLGGRDTMLQKAKLIAAADNPEQIATGVTKLYRATKSDALMEAWINMLLSGPQTHVVNSVSNALVQAWTLPERATAALIGKLHGGEKVYAREILPQIYGMAKGAKDGAKVALRTFITEEPSDILAKVEGPRIAIRGETFGLTGKAGAAVDAAGKAIRIPGRALTSMDEFFKSIGKNSELHALAAREGVREGLSGHKLATYIADTVRNPTPAMEEAAINYGRYVTFTKPLGPTASAIAQVANSHPYIKVIMPFVRTPTNIIKFAGERTPLAVFSKAVRAEIAKGGVARDMALARMALGSTVMAGVAALAKEGYITGGGPVEQQTRAALYRTGWQPYSFKINGTHYSFGRLEPLGTIVGTAADFAEIAGYLESNEADKLASLIMASAAKNITSKTWLRGLSNAIEAMDDPDRYMQQAVAALAGTAVPTGVAQYTRVKDPIMREARTAIDRIKSRLPGYSETLQPRLNLWGDPIVLSGGLGPDLISPVYTSDIKPDKVNDEIVRLRTKTGMPSRRINKVELTPEQYNEYVTYAGQPAKRVLDRMVNSPGWDAIPDFKKDELITDQIKEFRDRARELMVAKYPKQLKIQPAIERVQRIKR